MEIGMTERKPREMTFASWVDQQVSEAAERGAFDNLPGAGKPISRRGGTDAWLQDYLRREGGSAAELLPTPLRRRSGWWRRRRSFRPGFPAGHRACRTTAVSSSWLSGTGLPCMLLDVMAVAAMSAACPGPRPNAASPGTPSRVRVSPIQARPSSTDAPGFPVSSCAASAYRSRAARFEAGEP